MQKKKANKTEKTACPGNEQLWLFERQTVSRETAFMIQAKNGIIRNLRGSACMLGSRLYAERTVREIVFRAEAEARRILMIIKRKRKQGRRDYEEKAKGAGG